MCISSTPAEPDNPSTPMGRPGGYHRGKGAGGFDRPEDVPGSDYTFGVGPGGIASTILGLVPGVGLAVKGIAKAAGYAFDKLTDQKNVIEVGVKAPTWGATPRASTMTTGARSTVPRSGAGSAMSAPFKTFGDDGEDAVEEVAEANETAVLSEGEPIGATAGQPVSSFRAPPLGLSGRRGPAFRRGSVLGAPTIGRSFLGGA